MCGSRPSPVLSRGRSPPVPSAPPLDRDSRTEGEVAPDHRRGANPMGRVPNTTEGSRSGRDCWRGGRSYPRYEVALPRTEVVGGGRSTVVPGPVGPLGRLPEDPDRRPPTRPGRTPTDPTPEVRGSWATEDYGRKDRHHTETGPRTKTQGPLSSKERPPSVGTNTHVLGHPRGPRLATGHDSGGPHRPVPDRDGVEDCLRRIRTQPSPKSRSGKGS